MQCCRGFEESGVASALAVGELIGVKAFAFGPEDAADVGIDGMLDLCDLNGFADHFI